MPCMFTLQISVGYGEDMYGFQTVDWKEFAIRNDHHDSNYIGHEPLTQFHCKYMIVNMVTAHISNSKPLSYIEIRFSVIGFLFQLYN